jgi:hypothetical protein
MVQGMDCDYTRNQNYPGILVMSVIEEAYPMRTYTAPVSGQAAGEAAPIPAGCRDRTLISVAHEEGIVIALSRKWDRAGFADPQWAILSSPLNR